MRGNVRAFVRIAAESFSLRGPIFEFGSFQVDGQEAAADLRPFFPGYDYVGCDLRFGPGVDRVEDLANLTLADNSVPTIICVETLVSGTCHAIPEIPAFMETRGYVPRGGSIVNTLFVDSTLLA